MATERVIIQFRADGSRQVTREMNNIGKSAGNAATAAQTLRRALLFVGVGAALRSAVRTLAQFEQSIATVRAITGATGDTLQRFRDTARDLGATTRFSATQAAEGLIFLSRAGFTAEQSLGAIEGTLQLAQAGALDLGSAADIASNVLQGFRLTTDETGRVVDVLAAAANKSNTDVRQLGDALKFVAPAAAATGVSIEETTAAVGALSNAGIQATLAGTGLRQSLVKLSAPSSKAQKTLAQLGLSAEDVDVSSVGLVEAFRRLGDAGLSLSDAVNIFDVRTASAALTLAEAAKSSNDTTGSLARLTEELQNAEGTAERVADVMDDNLNGAILAVKSATEGIVLAFGELGATSFLTTFLRGLADVLRLAGSNAENLAQGIAVALVPAVISLTAALKVNPVVLFTTAIVAATAAIVAFRDEIELTDDGVVSLGDVFDVFASNIQTSIDVIGGALQDVFGPFVTDSANSIGEVESSFFGFARTLARIADTITLPFQVAVQAIANFFRFGFQAIGELVLNIINGIVQTFNGFVISIQRRLNNLVNTANNITARLPGTDGLDLGSVDLGGAFVSEFENDFEGAGQTLGDALKRGFELTTTGPGGFEQILDGIQAQSRLRGEERAAGDLPAEVERIREERFVGPPAPEGAGPGGAEAITAENVALDARGTILNRLADIRERNTQAEAIAAENTAILNELREAGIVNEQEFAALLEEFPNNIEQSVSALDSFAAAFQRVDTSAQAVAGAIGNAFVSAIGTASGALADFALSGFRDVDQLREAFANLLADLAKQILQIIIQTLILKAIQAGLGGVGAGAGQAIGGAVGGAATGATTAALQGRQAGGPVASGQPVLVGELGPEIFVPRGGGNVVPNAQMGRPEVNVQVVNVRDPNEISEALDDPGNQEKITNIIRTNRRAIDS
jgi:TP901 family phage tail tape measure protein